MGGLGRLKDQQRPRTGHTGVQIRCWGGLKLAMFAQFWKIIAHSRALAEIYVLAPLPR